MGVLEVVRAEHLGYRPGFTVVAGHTDGAVDAAGGACGVAKQEHLRQGGALGGVGEGTDEGGVVTRIGEVARWCWRGPGLAAVLRVGHLAEGFATVRGTGVVHQGAVGELHDLVFVHGAAPRLRGVPGAAPVVGEPGHGHDLARVGEDCGGLDEAAPPRTVLELDAVAGGSETGFPWLVTGDLVGDHVIGGVGGTTVGAFSVGGVEDVAGAGIGAWLGSPEALGEGFDVEIEYRAGLVVDHVGGVGVAHGLCLVAWGDDGGFVPGGTVVGGGALDDGIGFWCVTAVAGAPVPGREDRAAGGDGEGGDAVAAEAVLSAGGQCLFCPQRFGVEVGVGIVAVSAGGCVPGDASEGLCLRGGGSKGACP